MWCDPLWHSIWQLFGHSFWHLFWHSIWILSGILSLAFYFPVRPSTTSCYKACTKCFPVKLAQNASQSQYYFVLQSLRKVLPNTTLAQRIRSLKDQSRAALTMGNTRAPAAPVAQTRLPTSTPGVTLCEKTKGFVRFLPSKHHLDETSKPRSQKTIAQRIESPQRPALAI